MNKRFSVYTHIFSVAFSALYGHTNSCPARNAFTDLLCLVQTIRSFLEQHARVSLEGFLFLQVYLKVAIQLKFISIKLVSVCWNENVETALRVLKTTNRSSLTLEVNQVCVCV